MKLAVAFILSLHLTSTILFAGEQPLPNPISEDLLKEIIESATAEGTIDQALEACHVFPKSAGTSLFTEGRQEEKDQIEIRLQTKVAANGYLVMTRSDENGTLLQTDVTRYHETTRLFHRWQVFPGDKTPTRTFLGDPHQIKNPLEEERPFKSQSIYWRSIDSSNPVTIVEHFNSSEAGTGLVSSLLETSNNQVLRKESVMKFQPVLIPEEPKEKPSLLSRWFGKKDDAPAEEKAEAKVSTFEPLNFQFTHPGNGYLSLDPSKINPDASLFLINRQESAGFSIIVEALGEGILNIDQLKDLAVQNFRMVLTGAEVSYPGDVTIDGVTFATVSLIGNRGAARYRYVSFLASHNGYLCQLISYSRNPDEKAAVPKALEIAKGFRFIDRDRKALNATPLPPYQNPAMGISLSPDDANGIPWDPTDLWRQFPSADYGILQGQDGWMFLIPVDLVDLNPDDLALSSALFTQIGLHFENDVTKSTPHTQGSAAGFAYEASRRDQFGTAHYRIRVLRNGQTACLLCAVGNDLDEEKMSTLSALLDAFRFQAPLPAEEREKKSGHLRRDALALNQIGLHYYLRNEYREAIPYFKRSRKLDPTVANYLSNLVLAHHNDGHPGDALKILDEGRGAFANNPDVQALRPFLLNGLGRNTLAAEEYRTLFAQGYRNEDDLLVYLNLLSDLSRFDDAIAAIDGYLSSGKEKALRPQRWRHQIYSQGGRTEEALAFAGQLATKFPENSLVQLDHIIALIDSSQTKDALAKIETSLAKTPDDASLLYQRGRAYQGGKDYQKAKESYEAALQQAPNDYTISEALSFASSLLGQGDQSSIRLPIEPVSPPPALIRAFEEIPADGENDGFNSRTLRDIIGFHFKKGEPLRKTQTYEVKIFNQGGVEDYKTIRFEFDPTYERAFINEIEVTDAEGKVVSTLAQVESFVSDTSAQDGGMATTSSTVTATIPGLKPGCILRYQFTVQSLGGKDEFPFSLRFAASATPAGPSGYFVTGDFKELQGISRNASFRSTQDDSHRSWYLPEPARFYQENLLPPFHDYLPYLAIGSPNSEWKKLGDDYLHDLADRLQPDESTIALAQSLTADLQSDDAKASALVRHVQDRLVYQAIEFGTRGRIPERASRILKNRYGDCKDHSLLIYQLLRAVDIPANLSLVHTSLPAIPGLPSLDQFDHMIVHAPTIRGGSFYDATGKNTPIETTSPFSLEGLQALVLREGSSALMEIPSDAKVTHEVRIRRTVEAAGAPEKLTVTEEVSLHGSYADGLRGYMLSVDEAERRLNLEQILGKRHHLSITRLNFKNLDNPEQALGISVTYTMNDSFQTRGEKLQSVVPAIWEDFYCGIDQSGERRSPFKIQQPTKVTSQVTVSLPEGMALASPIWQPVISEGAGYSHELKVIDDRSIVNTLTIQPGLFQKELFGSYSKGLSKSLQALQGDLHLQSSN